MGNVIFSLKSPVDEKKENLVLLIFRYDGKKLVYSTGQKILKKHWDFENKCAEGKSKFPQSAEFNYYLKTLRNKTEEIYRNSLIESKPLSISEFKKALDISLNKVKQKETPTLLNFIDEFIQKRELAGKPKGSIQVYKKTLKHLKDYSKKYGKLNYEDIDIDFLDKFQNFLYSPPRSLSVNYSLKLIQNLKLFLNEASEYGYNINTAYKSRKFTIKKEDITHIYLTIEELEKMYNEDLSENPKLERVRDSFIVGCFTGLRFSDFSNLQPQHFKTIDGVEVVEIVTQKTKQKVVIPVHPKVRAILNKYNGVMPRQITNQKINEYLKELGKKVKIDEDILIVKTKGDKEQRKFLKNMI
ncbi:hypothetical protein DI487_12775 [Flavobacterium sediminis]|uniref:Uncharacterized protein n=1 Tax=Flavobacterium sediminis TaxID=2201181 RepID=A0A2U8QX68_9FLAO|nr:site-specific integrase [Flavobacterium sediminis]AWM14641.1 hypothetical protein DI487_12775 [Flavobacterium sediminis]